MSKNILDCTSYDDQILGCLAYSLNQGVAVQIIAEVHQKPVTASYVVTLNAPNNEDKMWVVFVAITEKGDVTSNTGYSFDTENKAKAFISKIFDGMCESQLKSIKKC